MALEDLKQKMLDSGHVLVPSKVLEEIENSKIVQGHSLTAIHMLLTDDVMYEHLKLFVCGKLIKETIRGREVVDHIKFFATDKGKLEQSKEKIFKSEFISVLVGMELTGKEGQRVEELKKFIGYEAFKKDYQHQIYSLKIKGKVKEFSVDKFIDFTSYNQEEISNFFQGADEERREFCYAMWKFFSQNSILKNYYFPSHIIGAIEKGIGESNLVDIEAIKEFNEGFLERKYADVEVDQEYLDYLFQGMPQDFSKMQQAIYMYLKMCDTLRYSSEVFAAHERGPLSDKHSDISRLKYINPHNNEIVCVEFNVIYAKVLSLLGIDYKVEEKTGEYGKGHAYLHFISDKFLVKADSTSSVLSGDLFRVKAHMPLVGFSVITNNEGSKKEFNDIVNSVYQTFNENKNVLSINEFERLKEEYCKQSDVGYVSLKEKVQIFFEAINRCNYVGMDKIAYIQTMKKSIFNEKELEENFKINILVDNYPKNTGKVIAPIIVFTVNPKNYNSSAIDSEYYICSEDGFVEKTDRKKLEKKLEKGIITAVVEKHSVIPGVMGKAQVGVTNKYAK